jgi:Protein of unknown function (DUF1573)
MRNLINYIAVVSILLAVSCRNKEDFKTITLDTKKNVVAYEHTNYQTPKVKSDKKPEEYPILEIENANFDFGDIKKDDKVEHVFKFTNKGKIGDLIIINVSPSCGCTVPEWTKTPVKPGESGEIKIIFNTAGKSGLQQKSIMVTANTIKENEVINFTANILTK